jgi:hypothetical protein
MSLRREIPVAAMSAASVSLLSLGGRRLPINRPKSCFWKHDRHGLASQLQMTVPAAFCYNESLGTGGVLGIV